MTRAKIRFIPNWATLAPGVRAVTSDNPYRRPLCSRFVVGLSGNLGFTHDPVIVFEAARLLRDNREVPAVGLGGREMQSEAKLPNVTLVDRVEDKQAGDVSFSRGRLIIPYRKSVA